MVFLKQFTDSPVQALQRAKEVLDIYLQLITQTHTTVNWSCATEYSNYTTVVNTDPPSTGTHRTNRLHVISAVGFLCMLSAVLRTLYYSACSVRILLRRHTGDAGA